MAQQLFDRPLVARRLARRKPGRDDFVTRLVLDDLSERLVTVKRTFSRALLLSPDASEMPETGRTAEGEFHFERVSTVLGAPFDTEALALPRTDYDLIVSLFDLQVIDDVPGFLGRLRRHLMPDGLLVAAALGGDSLRELRQASLVAETELTGGAHARVAPFIPAAEAGRLLQGVGFALPVGDVESHVVRYADAFALMRDLKAMGAANPLADRPTRMASRRLLAAIAAAYAAIAADPDGRVRATLEVVWMSGWAPHESQQRPLAPGSAKVSLADVLGRREG